MDAPQRGALLLVGFTATAVASMSLLEFGLYLAECHNHHAPVSVVHAGLLLLPFILCVIILARARAVAKWLANKLDE